MKPYYLWVILLFSPTRRCEWVEITPIVSKKTSEIKQVLLTTTPANYEAFMKTPFLKDEYSLTTPVYNFTESSRDENFMLDGYGRSTELSSSAESNTSFSFPNDESWERREHEDILEPPMSISNEGFLPFLKLIQDNLFKFKHKSRKSKMSLLKHLRDRLLLNIKERITSMWSPKASFEARGYKDEDSHMDFPSNEGALMTIGFLTFAVFLIKLVIKLVHALKYKQQYYGMTTTTTAASVVFLKRKKREKINEEAAKILQYIDEF